MKWRYVFLQRDSSDPDINGYLYEFKKHLRLVPYVNQIMGEITLGF